jgi:SSS family solute:Na+ symporter
LPIGLKGLVTAALLAAAMQTCSAALNSAATLFAYDIVKRYRPQTSDHRLVVVGKVTTVVGTVLAIVSSPLFGHGDTVFQALTNIICDISAPVTAVFLFGVFWKRTSGKAAFAALVIGTVLGMIAFGLEFYSKDAGGNSVTTSVWYAMDMWHRQIVRGFPLTSMMASFYLLVLCSAILVVGSYLFPEPLKEEARPLVWDNWLEPLRPTASGRGLADYRVMSLIVFVTFVLLYVFFSYVPTGKS